MDLKDGFFIEKFFDDIPCVVPYMPDFDAMLSDMAKELLVLGHDNKIIFFDLLFRNSPSDRFFKMELKNGKWQVGDCKPVAVSREQFEKVHEYYKANGLYDKWGEYSINNPQRFLFNRGSVDQLYRNYSFYERKRGTLP